MGAAFPLCGAEPRAPRVSRCAVTVPCHPNPRACPGRTLPRPLEPQHRCGAGAPWGPVAEGRCSLGLGSDPGASMGPGREGSEQPVPRPGPETPRLRATDAERPGRAVTCSRGFSSRTSAASTTAKRTGSRPGRPPAASCPSPCAWCPGSPTTAPSGTASPGELGHAALGTLPGGRARGRPPTLPRKPCPRRGRRRAAWREGDGGESAGPALFSCGLLEETSWETLSLAEEASGLMSFVGL